MKQIFLEDFVNFEWDCDICPLYPCRDRGFMLTEDCYDDVMAVWKKYNILPSYGFTQAVESRGE